MYYTKDKDGNYSQPRIAIRMEGNKIGEIRGISEHQNMEPKMEGILNKKLDEFPDKEDYLKKVHDMEVLTKVYEEYKDRELTKEEIRFLYEVDDKILGLGYQKDPRINEILNGRNFKKDLSFAFDCTEDEISNNKEDVLDGKKIVYFYGSLYLGGLESAEGLILPRGISMDLYLGSLGNAEGLILPKRIGGYLYLNSLKNTDGLTVHKNFECGRLVSNYISMEDLINKSLEESHVKEIHK